MQANAGPRTKRAWTRPCCWATCARVLVTGGDFDVSTCLTSFYRAVHSCVAEMSAGHEIRRPIHAAWYIPQTSQLSLRTGRVRDENELFHVLRIL